VAFLGELFEKMEKRPGALTRRAIALAYLTLPSQPPPRLVAQKQSYGIEVQTLP
jgi:hypothetical protein